MSIQISFDQQNFYPTIDDHDGSLGSHIERIMGQLAEPRPTEFEARQGSSPCAKHPDMLPWRLRDRKSMTLGELYWPTLFQTYSDLLVAIPCDWDKPLWWEHPAVMNGQIFGENAGIKAYVQFGKGKESERIGLVMRVIDCFRFGTQYSDGIAKLDYTSHPHMIIVRLSDERFYRSRDVVHFGAALTKPASLWQDITGFEVTPDWSHEVEQWDTGFAHEEETFGFALDPNIGQAEQGLLNDALAWMNGVVPVIVPKFQNLSAVLSDSSVVANYGFAPAATFAESAILPSAWDREEWSAFTCLHPYPRININAGFGSPEIFSAEQANFIWESKDGYDDWKDRKLTVDVKGNFTQDGWVQSDFYYNIKEDRESVVNGRRVVITSLYSNQKSEGSLSGSGPVGDVSKQSGAFTLDSGFPSKALIKAAAKRFQNQYEWLRRVSLHQDGLYFCSEPEKLMYQNTLAFDVSRLACDSFYIRSVEQIKDKNTEDVFGLLIVLRSYHPEMPTFDVPVTWNQETGELSDIDTGEQSYAEGEVVQVNGSTEFARVTYSRSAYLPSSIVPLLMPNFWPALRVGEKINMQRFPERATEWWDPQWVPMSKEC